MDGKSKLEDIKHEDFRDVQSYMNNKSIAVGRMAFRIRCKMVADIPANFKNKYKRNEEGLLCKYCDDKEVMNQAHCTECVKWNEIRRDLDLTNIEDLVQFFINMMEEKSKIDKENSKSKGSQGGSA